MELSLAKSNPREDIGLALLGVGTTFGVWSSLNTSPVGVVAFGTENEAVARAGMNLSLILIEGIGAGIYLVYGTSGRIAAIATGLSGVALWIFYDHLLKKGSAPKILAPMTPTSSSSSPTLPPPPVFNPTPILLVNGR